MIGSGIWLRLLALLVLQQWRARPTQAALGVFGVAVGVAVTVGIDLAVTASVQSFTSTVSALAGRTTHTIVGGPEGLDETWLFETLQNHPPGLGPPLSGVLDRVVLAHCDNGDAPGQPSGQANTKGPSVSGALARTRVRLLGVDPFSDRDFRAFSDVANTLSGDDLTAFLSEPATAVVIEPLARRLGLPADGRGIVHIAVGPRQHQLRVLGTFALPGPAGAALTDLMVTDIATAQEVLDSVGRLDRIDLRADSDNPTHQAALERLADQLPSGARLVTADQTNATLRDLVAAYQLNLQALALMAVVVATFVVYNAMLVCVAARRTHLAIVRCLGASSRLLATLVAGEAALMGLFGAALGLGAGWLLAGLLTGYVAQTVSQFYAVVAPVPVSPDGATLLKAGAVGLAAALLGALVPIRQVAAVEPILAVRTAEPAFSARREASRGLTLAGAVLIAAGWVALDWPAPTVTAGFVGAGLILLGAAALCRAALLTAVVPLAWLMGTLTALTAGRRLAVVAHLGTRRAAHNPGTTAVTVAALMTALAMSVALSTMIAGFRDAVGRWLDRRYQADVFFGPAATLRHMIPDAPLNPQLADLLANDPDVACVSAHRTTAITVTSPQTGGASATVQLVATNLAELFASHALDLRQTLSANVSAEAVAAGGVSISQPVAVKLALAPGDTLTLPTRGGPRLARVLAVHNDYTTDRGQILIDRATYLEWFDDPTITGLYVSLHDASPQAAADFRDRWADHPQAIEAVVLCHGDVRREALAIFDRTFAITTILQWMAYLTGFAGLTGALTALAARRARELAVLRLIGLNRSQALTLLTAEALCPALIAAFMALAVGTVMAWILAEVVQFRSFGWAIPLAAQPAVWGQTLALAVAAALPAVLVPYLRLMRSDPAVVLREV